MGIVSIESFRLFVVLYRILLQLLDPQIHSLTEQPCQDRTSHNVPVVDDDDAGDVETCVNHLNESKSELCQEYASGKPMRNLVFKRICR